MGTEHSNVPVRKSARDLSCEVKGTKRSVQLTLLDTTQICPLVGPPGKQRRGNNSASSKARANP